MARAVTGQTIRFLLIAAFALSTGALARTDDAHAAYSAACARAVNLRDDYLARAQRADAANESAAADQYFQMYLNYKEISEAC